MKIPVPELIEKRKELHREPEVSGMEHKTAQKIETYLKEYQPDEMITSLGGTGIAAIYKGKEDGPTLLFRCELDALPIQEINQFEHKSITEGVSHKCGHDGHMTIMLGLAGRLRDDRIKKGRVVLLFQPSEENGQGAAAVLNDEKFQSIKPDYCFSLHNVPGYELGEILLKSGSITPAVNSIIVKFHGMTSHAGEPLKGRNPALAIADYTKALWQLSVPDNSKDDYLVVTPVYLQMGEKAYGISAGEGEAHFTMRCLNNDQMKRREEEAEQLAKDIAEKYKLKVEIHWTESFFANENDETATNWVRESTEKCGYKLRKMETPFNWGEDFGLFTKAFPGAMFGLGAGMETPALHNPDYDFPDELIEPGVRLFSNIINAVHGV